MRQICNRRRVFVETAIFAKGAAMKAEDYLNESGSGSFVCLCEGKLKSTVSHGGYEAGYKDGDQSGIRR